MRSPSSGLEPFSHMPEGLSHSQQSLLFSFSGAYLYQRSCGNPLPPFNRVETNAHHASKDRFCPYYGFARCP